MAKTITLNAGARCGYGGKQFIARVTGRDSKFTFSREFIGRKGGKRGEDASVTIDTPGLYQTRDIDSKGRADDTYYVVEECADGIKSESCALEDAMQVAKLLDTGTDFAAAVAIVWPPRSPVDLIRAAIENQKSRLAVAAAKDSDGVVTLDGDTGTWTKGTSVVRSELMAWRQGEIVRLEAELVALMNPSVEIIADPKADAIAHVKVLMAELGVTVADLS